MKIPELCSDQSRGCGTAGAAWAPGGAAWESFQGSKDEMVVKRMQPVKPTPIDLEWHIQLSDHLCLNLVAQAGKIEWLFNYYIIIC